LGDVFNSPLKPISFSSTLEKQADGNCVLLIYMFASRGSRKYNYPSAAGTCAGRAILYLAPWHLNIIGSAAKTQLVQHFSTPLFC